MGVRIGSGRLIMTPGAASPRRVTIPFLVDLVVVSDPDQIRLADSSGDVDRLHRYETHALPWWVRFFFRATKFHDDRGDLWFCPMESATNPTYVPRRNYLAEKAALGYRPEDVRAIAALLAADAPDAQIAQEMVQVVNRRFFEREVPPEITREAKWTLQTLGEALFPWKYRRGRAAQRSIMDFCEAALPVDVHRVDAGHNIGEVVQATVPALKRLRANLDTPVERLFTRYAPTPQVLRIAIRDSNLGGLLRTPMRAGRTVVILKVGRAASQTGSLRFTFGTGGPDRLCVFQDFFISFMRDLQGELRSRGGG